MAKIDGSREPTHVSIKQSVLSALPVPPPEIKNMRQVTAHVVAATDWDTAMGNTQLCLFVCLDDHKRE